MGIPHYFIGIPVEDEQLIDLLVDRQKWLREHMDYKVWTEPEDFHMTLRFLGEVKDLSDWKYRVEEASRYSSFSVKVSGTDFFGSKKTPRVVYQASSLPPELHHLYSHFQESDDGRFSPHITLAKKWREGVLPPDLPKDDFTWEIDTCALFRIHPGTTPKYEKVTSGFLKK
ncbi:RNA 2',3'-cyclic phosphodiesterase [Salimicrobium halophilum]|uniref:RNA 2',3'-cyclic phosphodiesterase n=1 Tax=Salimicrobium halophilum TaxID=86666 RepID=A0A1G8VL35_9BACI|nr:RNA 2',3'-cyclic phosphodiesterase [Salimicrobium halophilum]SDJ66669.1 2'-5' RNA ligase [Salimicrobium halophilum]